MNTVAAFVGALISAGGEEGGGGERKDDKNLVENAIRPLALGRKILLFCGDHDAAIRAAIVYSLVDICKSRGVASREWKEDVSLRIPGNENKRDALRELLPDKWDKFIFFYEKVFI